MADVFRFGIATSLKVRVPAETGLTPPMADHALSLIATSLKVRVCKQRSSLAKSNLGGFLGRRKSLALHCSERKSNEAEMFTSFQAV